MVQRLAADRLRRVEVLLLQFRRHDGLVEGQVLLMQDIILPDPSSPDGNGFLQRDIAQAVHFQPVRPLRDPVEDEGAVFVGAGPQGAVVQADDSPRDRGLSVRFRDAPRKGLPFAFPLGKSGKRKQEKQDGAENLSHRRNLSSAKIQFFSFLHIPKNRDGPGKDHPLCKDLSPNPYFFSAFFLREASQVSYMTGVPIMMEA